MKKESIIGVIALAIFIAFMWVYTSIKRSGVLSRHFSIYAKTIKTFGIKRADPVKINGYIVGSVSDVQRAADGISVLITLDFNKPIQLPATTTAQITYSSILGGRQIDLLLDTLCESSCLIAGATIPCIVLDIPQQIENATIVPRAAIDKLWQRVGGAKGIEEIIVKTQASIHQLRNTTVAFNKKMGHSSKSIKKMSLSLQQNTTWARNNVPKILQELDSIRMLTDTVRHKNLDKMLSSTTLKIDTFGQTIATTAHQYLDKTNTALVTINKKIKELPKNKTAHTLLYNDTLPRKIFNRIDTLQNTIRNVYEHPEKYRKIN